MATLINADCGEVRMIKRIAILLFVLLYGLNSTLAFAWEWDRAGNVEEGQKLKEVQATIEEVQAIPGLLVEPDAIYIVTELKALYYQNTEIIRLLREIRELLRQSLEEKEEEER